MKRTLRLVGVAAMVLLLAASCKKEEKNNGETRKVTFTAGIEQTGAKTGLQSGDEAHAFKQVWTPNDAINVNGTPLTVSINPDDNTQGTFTGKVTATGKYYAVYPTSATLSGSTATFTLPESQKYVAGSYESNLAPMAAYTENNELNFRNLCGLMELSLTGTNVTVTSLELRCDKPICGTATYNIDNSEPLAMAAEAGNMVSMDCSTGVPLNGTASFIFVLPPVESGAFSLKVSYTAGANAIQMTKSLGNITIVASQVAYNTSPYELVGVNGTVTTGDATNVTSSGASVPYTVTPNGVSQARQHGVCYGTSENPSISGAHTVATDATYTASLNGLDANTTYHVRAYAIFERASRNEGDVVVYGEEKSFKTEAGSSAPDGFVDFGTHVGGADGTDEPLYWSKYNVGANNVVTNKGNYFMWGYAENCSNKKCNWPCYGDGEYKYNLGDADQFTKYMSRTGIWCAPGYTPDNKTVLDLTIDDAAYYENNSNRTPSKAEMEELLSVSYIKSVTSYNGKSVTGYIVYKAKHDSDKGKMDGTPHESYSIADTHIFIPVTGYRQGVNNVLNAEANLWSNTRYPEEQYAYGLYLDSNGSTHKVRAKGRFWGYCVRPVREQNPND